LPQSNTVNAASEAEAQCVEYEIFAIILRSHGSGLDPELIVRDVVRKTKVAIALAISSRYGKLRELSRVNMGSTRQTPINSINWRWR
jgi:hypothetical protein